MKWLTVATLTIACLALIAPAFAQDGDPLTLAAGGVLIPFFSNAAIGDISILEVASPRGNNQSLHLIFYDANCAHVSESTLPLTINDVGHVDVGGFLPNTEGLIAIRASGGPLANPIHARVYWLNVLTRRTRVIEPITVQQFNSDRTWNPLRTGATFFAPLNTAAVQTTLYLVCPKPTIQSGDNGNAAFPSPPFPLILPPFLSDYTSALRSRIYDTNEAFLVDNQFDCNCLKRLNVADLAGPYISVPGGTYTEFEPAAGDGFAFTGYKAISVVDSYVDLFGRLSNGSRNDIGGTGATPDNR